MENQKLTFDEGDLNYSPKVAPLTSFTKRSYSYQKYSVVNPKKIDTSDELFSLSFENSGNEYRKKVFCRPAPILRRGYSEKENTSKHHKRNSFHTFLSDKYIYQLVEEFIEEHTVFFAIAVELKKIIKEERINIKRFQAYKRINKWEEFTELAAFLAREGNIEHLLSLIVQYYERCVKRT